MIDLSDDVDALISSKPIRLTPVGKIAAGVRRRRRRRTALVTGAGAIVSALVTVVVIDVARTAPTQIAAGSDGSVELAEGFQWFEGDGFAVQIPADWDIPQLEYPGLQPPAQRAWSLGPRQEVRFRVSISDFSYVSFDLWLDFELPIGHGYGLAPYDGDVSIESFDVPGAVKAVRAEQESAASWTTREDSEEIIAVTMKTEIVIAAWQPDGHVVSLLLTIHEDSGITEETVETILGSFTLRPVS